MTAQGVVTLIFFAIFVTIFAKVFFGRKRAKLAAAKQQKNQPLNGVNYCPTCGRRLKGKEQHD